MAEPGRSSEGWILGLTVHRGALAVARQSVVVVDHGTGVGDALRVLLLDDERAAEVEQAASVVGLGSAPHRAVADRGGTAPGSR